MTSATRTAPARYLPPLADEVQESAGKSGTGSAPASAIQATTDLYCHGLHTDSRKRKLAMACGNYLGRAPGVLEFDVVNDFVPPPDGRAWTRCHKCGRWNAFKILAMVQAGR